MKVSYLFQDRSGQYSGDYGARSGVFVFQALRNDKRLKNLVIKRVLPKHPGLSVNLEQILVMPFDRQGNGGVSVSVRFKVVRRIKINQNLVGKQIQIRGVLNFEGGRAENFSTVLPIANLYEGGGY